MVRVGRVRRVRGNREKNEGSVRSARQVESVEGRASHSVSGNLMSGQAEGLRAEDLVNASGGRFSVKVLEVNVRSLRGRGMKSGSRDRGAKRVSVLRGSGRIARTTREARV